MAQFRIQSVISFYGSDVSSNRGDMTKLGFAL